MDTTKYPRAMCPSGSYPTMSDRHPRCTDCDTLLVLRSSDLAVCNQCNEYRDMSNTDLEGFL